MSKKNDARNWRQMAPGIIAHFLVAVWMIFIFYMSAQPGDVSGDISGGVSHFFMKVWNVFFSQGWSEAEILHMAEIWDYPIRKLAHMTEFGILAMMVYWVLGQYSVYTGISSGIKKWIPAYTKYIATWIFTVTYAATDEIHQLFVQDRSGNAFDVCVDAIGVLLALLMVWGIPRIADACKRKTQR